jgi:tetratricopeptide (TPR) repeat protein
LSAEALPSVSSLWNWSDIPETEQVFRKEAARADSAGDVARTLVAETQVARALGLQEQFDAAHAVLDSVETRLTAGISSASTTASEVEVRLRLERGRAWNSSGNSEAAKRPFADAYEIAVAEKLEYLAIDAAHMMAIVETGDAARVWFERGVQIAESSVDPDSRGWLGPLYNNYGWTLHDAGLYERALVVFEKAVVWRQENSGPVQVRIAHYAVARTLRSLGRCPDALVILRELETQLLASSEQDGYVDEEMGECLLATGRKKEAQPYFRKAWELLSKDPWLQKNETARLQRLQELAGP